MSAGPRCTWQELAHQLHSMATPMRTIRKKLLECGVDVTAAEVREACRAVSRQRRFTSLDEHAHVSTWEHERWCAGLDDR